MRENKRGREEQKREGFIFSDSPQKPTKYPETNPRDWCPR